MSPREDCQELPFETGRLYPRGSYTMYPPDKGVTVVSFGGAADVTLEAGGYPIKVVFKKDVMFEKIQVGR